jgi:hypothetical protein
MIVDSHGSEERTGFFQALRNVWRSDRLLFLGMLAVAGLLIWATRDWHSYLERYAVVVGWGSFICGPMLLWRQTKHGRTGRHSRPRE